MGANTKISWADDTVNFWHGCEKVSAGCKFCYMYRDKKRYGQDPKQVIRARKEIWNLASKLELGKLIFTCSWSDFFIKKADQWRPEAWDVIRANPQHTWMILTKRPERIPDCLPADWGKGWDHVWLGVSVENQKTALFRIPKLFEVPAKVRFISAEPLLQRVDLAPFLKVKVEGKDVYPIHWVIAGGESGNETGEFQYRPCKTEWLHEIVKACKNADVPVHIKQLGTAAAKMCGLKARHGDDITEQGFPDYLKVQEFPMILAI